MILRTQTRLSMASGVNEDSPVNTLWFSTENPFTDFASIATAIKGAYDQVVTDLAATVNQNGHVLKMYNMLDPTPRAPVYDSTFNLAGAPSGNTLPAEVALCVSFQAARVSGQSQARRRGRIYLGPLDTNTLNVDGRPVSATINRACAFGASLLAASVAAANWDWVVWSDVEGTSSLVTNGWVDNTFDTQRRRGLAVTVKSTWT